MKAFRPSFSNRFFCSNVIRYLFQLSKKLLNGIFRSEILEFIFFSYIFVTQEYNLVNVKVVSAFVREPIFFFFQCYVLRPFRALSTLRHIKIQRLYTYETQATVNHTYIPEYQGIIMGDVSKSLQYTGQWTAMAGSPLTWDKLNLRRPSLLRDLVRCWRQFSNDVDT